MNIIVCIKQVPDTTDVKINPQTNTLVRDGVRVIVNPFDLFAVEEALKLRDEHGGRVTILTMGPPQAREALEEAVAMGADDAILLCDQAFAGSDTLATSYALSQAIKKFESFDLIICGKQATDGDTAQVGPGIAAQLMLPQVTVVRRVLDVRDHSIVVEHMTDDGMDIIEAPRPCLITIVKKINVPRYASLKGKIRSKRMNIPTWGPEELKCDIMKVGLEGSPTWVERIFPPPVRKGCTPLQATEVNIEQTVKEIKEFIVEIQN